MRRRQPETNELDDILHDLSQIESALLVGSGPSSPRTTTTAATAPNQHQSRSRRFRHRNPGFFGQAMFESIGGMLNNLRHRLNHRATTTTSSSRAARNNDDQLSTISQRLETAQLAHSNRIPLDLLQNRETMRRRGIERASLVRTVSSSSTISTATTVTTTSSATTAVIENRRSGTSFIRRTNTTTTMLATPRAGLTRPRKIMRPSSSPLQPNSETGISTNNTTNTSPDARILASRTRSGSMMDLNIYGDGERVLSYYMANTSPRLEDSHSPAIEVVMQDSHQQSQTNNNNNMLVDITVEEEQNRDSKSVDVIMEDSDYTNETIPPPAPLVSSPSLESVYSLTRSVSGSIVLHDDETTEVQKKKQSQASLGPSQVYSWGSNISLHDDDTMHLSPTLVNRSNRIGRLPSAIISVSCGPKHCAVATSEGQVYACGTCQVACGINNQDKKKIIRPALIESLLGTTIRQVSCGWDHTAALSTTGTVLTWGSNVEGQLGHSTTPGKSPHSVAPRAMVLGAKTQAASVACGNQFTMVLTTRMSVLICGRSTIAGHDCTNDNNNDTHKNNTPCRQLPVLVGLPISFITAGNDHAVVLTVHGNAFVWGSNNSGCCGRPHPKLLHSPVPIALVSRQARETLLGWVPFSDSWRLAQGGAMDTNDPAADLAIVHAACGDNHTILVTRSGNLWVCGSNHQGQLGNDVAGKPTAEHAQLVRHPIPGSRFVGVEAGSQNTLLLDDQGHVWEMSSITGGRLAQVLTGKKILTITAGGDHRIALSLTAGRAKQLYLNAVGQGGEETSVLTSASKGTLTANMQELVSEINRENQSQEYATKGRELIHHLEEILQHPAVLNSLFLNVSELDNLYSEIANIANQTFQQDLAACVERGIRNGLERLQESSCAIGGARMVYPESVRCLLLYLRFFDETERERNNNKNTFDPRGSCIQALCEALLSLPFEGFRGLLAWISRYSRQPFTKMLVEPLLSQLRKALRVSVDSNGVEHKIVPTRTAYVIAAVLQWLYSASVRSNIAKHEDFHSNAISEYVPLEQLFEDLERLKTVSKEQRSNYFLLCEYPFLIPTSTKRDLLQMESQVNMIKTAVSTPTATDEVEGTITINPYFVLEIDRERLYEQTVDIIRKAKPSDLRRKLKVKFKNEEGVDAGGVTKEFFQILSEDLFGVHSSLWTNKYGEEVTWFNSDCTWDDEGYELVGVLVGLALYNSVLLDVHFPQAVYRKLLGLPLGLEDLVDESLRRGLQQLLDYEGDDVETVFCLTFEVAWMDLGQERKVELKPGGAKIEVSKSNKEEYVLLYVKWLLVDSIQPQWFSFKSGVDRIMERSSLNLFRPEELELLVVGTPQLDFKALEANTTYEGGYDSDSSVVRNFWDFMQNVADDETQRNFLRFATGSSKAPIGGLGSLSFKIQRAGPDSMQLPTSHTCFNTLLLPDYGTNSAKLTDRLGRAILECEGFGLE